MIHTLDLMFFKEEHKGHKIIYLLINGKEFVFRTLGKKEYKDILAICSTEHELEEMICEVSVLHPNDYDFRNTPLAGLPQTVAPIVVDLSGFTNPDKILQDYEDYKDQMNSFEHQCRALVKSAFPEFTFEEMEEWTWDRLLDVTSKAEYILNIKGYNIELVQSAPEQQLDESYAIEQMIASGADPMMHYGPQLTQHGPYLDFPLIGGIHWQDEGILNEIRRQMGRHS